MPRCLWKPNLTYPISLSAEQHLSIIIISNKNICHNTKSYITFILTMIEEDRI